MNTEGTKVAHKQFLFTGEWIPDQDPLKIGEQNCAVLRNTRYGDTGLEGVLGYSKINTTALATYLKGRAGIQLKSPYSGQNSILIQAKNAAETDGAVLENKTAVPSQGNFEATELHVDASGADRGRFSKWPGGHIAYSNGKETLVYAGNEMRVAGCINYAPDGSFRYKYTKVVQNMEQDAGNVALLHRVSEALDANTLLLLHLDNNVTDSSPTTPHTVTFNGTAAYSTTRKFGTHSAKFNGTDAYLSIPDDADFDFSGGTFTVDCWVRLNDLPAAGKRFPLYQHETAGTGNDWFEIYIDANGAVKAQVKADHGGAPTVDVDLVAPNGTIKADQWYHIEIDESGDNWWIFVDGVQRAYLSDADRCANYTGSVLIGYNGDGAGYYLDGYLDEGRVSNSARHTGAFEVPGAAYGSSSYTTYLDIGTIRAIKALKIYMKTVNTTAGAVNVEYWNGAARASVSGLTDGTQEAAGVPLSKAAGSISFDTTVDLAKIKATDGVVLYWYRVTITECDDTAEIYHISVDAPMQPILDLWDGLYRTPVAFLVYNGANYEDFTTNVAEEDYSSVNDATFASLNALAGANHALLGFQEPQMGFVVTVVPGAENTNPVVLSLYGWDGSGWHHLGTIEDGTVQNNGSIGKSGTATFNPMEHNTEFPTEISKKGAFYYYKLQWSGALSATVSIDYIGGIPAPKQLSGGYKFPFEFQGRPMRCNYVTGKEGGRVDYGSAYTTEVHNGDDTSDGLGGPIYFGGTEDLLCACEIFNRFGSTIYNVAVFCKAAETYILDGTGPDTWTVKRISSIVGCPAAMTMDTAEVAWAMEGDVTRNIALWLTGVGPIIFDAGVLIPFKRRISHYFDQERAEAIDLTKIGDAVGWTDPNSYEYNLIFDLKSGAKAWICLDLIRKKWFEKVPQAAAEPYLHAAFRVMDSEDTTHLYGLRDNGYMMRLENGTTWDGVAITQTIKTGKLAYSGDMWDITQIEKLKLLLKGITEADVNVTVNHYKNDEAAANVLALVSATGSGYLRYVKPGGKLYEAWAHQLEFIASTSATSRGVPILGYNVKWTFKREETRDAQ